MTTRITYGMINTTVMHNLFRNNKELGITQEQLSSGKLINRPSDAPIEMTNTMEIRERLAAMNQHNRNITDGQAYTAILDTTMRNTSTLMQHVRELAVQGATDTLTREDRSFILDDAKQNLLSLVSISNTKHKDDYIFSGKFTDVAPFSLEKGTSDIDTDLQTRLGLPAFAANDFVGLYDHSRTDSALTNADAGSPPANRILPGSVQIIPNSLEEGTDYEIDYQNGRVQLLSPDAVAAANLPNADAGHLSITYEYVYQSEKDHEGIINRELSSGVAMQINTTSSQMFGDKRNNQMDAFSSVISLMEGLYKNNGDDIRTAMGNIDESFNRMLSAQSTTGARANRMENQSDRTSEMIIHNTNLQSNIEDLDFAEAISRFMLQESVFNASLKTAGRVLQPSLVDFV
jgi:flagellar hook-associated protein 3 FlgL